MNNQATCAKRKPSYGALALLLLIALVTFLVTGLSRAETPTRLSPLSNIHGGELVVPVNKSQILRVDRPFTELLVGNPQIADIMALTDRSVYVLGKAVGSTNLSIYGRDRTLIAVVDLNVSYDAEGLKAKLHEMLPRENIEVRAVNASVVLSGTVSSPAAGARAMSIAERYAPGQVTNLLSVGGSQQVMLSVRIAEVSRSVAHELGIRPNFIVGGGEDRFTFVTLDPLDVTRFATGLLSVVSGNFTLDLLIDALEDKGVVKILAEPNLVALSGDTASFLAGGEFPIPVAQDEDTITVEFKEFGVSLAFTPTVLEGGLINMMVAPEVSQIDSTNTVRVSGILIPGLSTRRAKTTVELRDGQSFAIAGLLQSNFTDQVRQLPGIGDLPVLGALFRSSEFQRRETELVIIITPKLVQPAPAGSLAAPTDTFIPPTDAELFLLGRTEGRVPAGTDVLSAQPGGGIDGKYGHILK